MPICRSKVDLSLWSRKKRLCPGQILTTFPSGWKIIQVLIPPPPKLLCHQSQRWMSNPCIQISLACTTDLTLVIQAMPPPSHPRPTTPAVKLIPPTPENSVETLQSPSVIHEPTPPVSDSVEPIRLTPLPQADHDLVTTAPTRSPPAPTRPPSRAARQVPSGTTSPPAPPGPRRGRSRTPLVLSVPGPVTRSQSMSKSPSSVGKC